MITTYYCYSCRNKFEKDSHFEMRDHLCITCWNNQRATQMVLQTSKNFKITGLTNQASRADVPERYDLLVPEFIRQMSLLVSVGADKYGDRNWQKSRLSGGKGPVNRIHRHLGEYQLNQSSPELGGPEGHLVSIAVNAMFEWWYYKMMPQEGERKVKENEEDHDRTNP